MPKAGGGTVEVIKIWEALPVFKMDNEHFVTGGNGGISLEGKVGNKRIVGFAGSLTNNRQNSVLGVDILAMSGSTYLGNWIIEQDVETVRKAMEFQVEMVMALPINTEITNTVDIYAICI